jgi:PIN domain nuclease of toxin-antitoxin system
VRLLLDTHIWLWFLADLERLPPHVLAAIEGADDVRLSAVCIWETVIKVGAGKLVLPMPATELVAVSHRDAGMQPLAVDARHALAVRELPDHHRDPFDRLLVAQARVEGLTLVTADAKVQAYDVPVLGV